jgi:amidase
VAWCPDLGGLPLDPRVRGVLDPHRRTLESIGCIVEDASPDLTDADEVFLTIRQRRSWLLLGDLLARHRDRMKPEAVWEIEAGARLDDARISHAIARHADLRRRVDSFFGAHDFFACAVNQVPPFEADSDWPHAIDGVAMEHYVAWMKSAYWISATCCPAISVPAGFTSDGLPVGLQIVGRFRDDAGVLRLAYAFEQATGVGGRRPV